MTRKVRLKIKFKDSIRCQGKNFKPLISHFFLAFEYGKISWCNGAFRIVLFPEYWPSIIFSLICLPFRKIFHAFINKNSRSFQQGKGFKMTSGWSQLSNRYSHSSFLQDEKYVIKIRLRYGCSNYQNLTLTIGRLVCK